MNRKELIDYKSTLKLNQYQLELLIGCLLGDATIPKQLPNRTHSIKFEQSVVNGTVYVWMLYEIFKDFVGTEPKVRNIKGGNAANRESIWFRTYRHEIFTEIYKLFYVDGRKVVPKDLINQHFTEVSLAYWFMDDGSKCANSYKISSHSFSYQDNEFLVKFLKDKFNLDFTIQKDDLHCHLYIRQASADHFKILY